jgi:methylglutaconyl-CoA hydratase
VATVTLNRPEVHNAFNALLIAELTRAFGLLATRNDVHVIVLKGNGPSFCAGADINWMRDSLDYSTEGNIADALRMSDMFSAIRDAPQPVVGRVHGAALGGGMGLVAVCDISVAASDTRFGFTEARLGIVPAVISRFVVPKIGESWARALFLTAERFDAARAERIGIIHHVAAPEALDAVVVSVLSSLRACGPQALRTVKTLLHGLTELAEAEQRQFTAQTIARARTGDEGQEGLRAFLEKREPSWRSVVEDVGDV